MIFHENCLLADNSHEISYLNLLNLKKQQILTLLSAENYRWRFKSETIFYLQYFTDYDNIHKIFLVSDGTHSAYVLSSGLVLHYLPM